MDCIGWLIQDRHYQRQDIGQHSSIRNSAAVDWKHSLERMQSNGCAAERIVFPGAEWDTDPVVLRHGKKVNSLVS